DLSYTESSETGHRLDTGVIHRMNARSCVAAGDLLVDIKPSDVTRAFTCDPRMRRNPPPAVSPHAPVIDDLAYDSKRNSMWFNLGHSDWQEQSNLWGSCVFSVPLLAGDGNIAAATMPWLDGCGGGKLNYDPADDSLWTCGTGPNNSGSWHIAAEDHR